MTPKEFTDNYIIGTKFHLDLERYGFTPKLSTGIYEYVGIRDCDYENGCNMTCKGRMLIKKDGDDYVHKECLAFSTNRHSTKDKHKLKHEIPLGRKGIVCIQILEKELFEI